MVPLTISNSSGGSLANVSIVGACGVITVGGGALVDIDFDASPEGLNCAIDYHGITGGGHGNWVGDDVGMSVDVSGGIAVGGASNVVGCSGIALGGSSNWVLVNGVMAVGGGSNVVLGLSSVAGGGSVNIVSGEPSSALVGNSNRVGGCPLRVGGCCVKAWLGLVLGDVGSVRLSALAVFVVNGDEGIPARVDVIGADPSLIGLN